VFSFIVLILALITLILAQSRTSLIGLVIAICVQLFFDRRFVLLLSMLILGVILAASTQFSNVTEQYLVRGQDKELFTSLSGRTHGWEAAWASFQQSPIIGHGFAAAARTEILGTSGASTLHGSIFDVMVGVGLLGSIPWGLAIVWTSLRLLALARRGHPRWKSATFNRSVLAEMLGVLALILVRSSTSSGLAMHEHDFMLFLAVVAYASAALHPLRHPVGTSSGRQSVSSHANTSRRARVVTET
jgi:O-antigen ligase